MFYKTARNFTKRAKIALFVCGMVFLFFSRSYADTPAGYNIWQVTESYGLDDRSQFMSDNGDLVWTAWNGFLYEIFYLDTSNLVFNAAGDKILNTVQITSDSTYSNYHPVVNNSGDIVWDSNGQVYLYSSGTTTQISTGATNGNTTPVISSDGDIVWVGKTGALSTTTEIYYYDGSTTQITSNALRDSSPRINDGGGVVWQERIGSAWQVFYRDSSGAITQVTNTAFSNQNPQINSSDKIVWQGADNNIYLSIGGAAPTAIGIGTSPQINANGDIVWKDGTDVKLYKDGVTTTVATNANSYTTPKIGADGTIVWSGTDGENNEIFYYKGGDLTQLTFTAAGYTNLDPSINSMEYIPYYTLDDSGGPTKVYLGAPVIPLPEPLSCFLFATGAFPLALRRFRRKKAPKSQSMVSLYNPS